MPGTTISQRIRKWTLLEIEKKFMPLKPEAPAQKPEPVETPAPKAAKATPAKALAQQPEPVKASEAKIEKAPEQKPAKERKPREKKGKAPKSEAAQRVLINLDLMPFGLNPTNPISMDANLKDIHDASKGFLIWAFSGVTDSLRAV